MARDDPFALFETRRHRRDQERMALRKRLAELDAEANDDAIAVRQLSKAYSNSEPVQSGAALPPPALGTTSVLQAHQRARDMPIKDVIFVVLRDAGHGLTASQIKAKALLRYGREINSNTLTVTLVRASKQKGDQMPLVRCEGRVWHYLRQPEAPNIRAPQVRGSKE